MVEAVSALLIVLGVIALVRALLQFPGLARPAPSRSSLRVVETCTLGNRQRLHLVEVGGERLLIGVNDSGQFG